MEKFVVLEKQVGETPLQCAEAWRAAAGVDASVPLAYAGRLDPMASGKLLVLIGDECKSQTNYHGLDKAYDFSVLFGIGSDTHDVLGRLSITPPPAAAHSAKQRLCVGGFGWGTQGVYESSVLREEVQSICQELEGKVELPYPHFSSKTIQGKPLHMWTLEGRLDEIEIPTKASTIYSLELTDIETKSRTDVAAEARAKIDTIPEVTDPKKALGNDFRRVDVRADWQRIAENTFSDNPLPDTYHIAHFHCIASSGTYMRTLAKMIGGRLTPPTPALAWHIHRTNIGAFDPFSKTWTKDF